MIAIDTSVLVAIALEESGWQKFMTAINDAGRVLISSASVLETKMVIHNRLGPHGILGIDNLLRLSMIEIIPPISSDIETAYQAFAVFGKGSGHAANLNFGDLFAYALAKNRNLPLLFKGDDFSKTDVRVAKY